MKNRLFVSELAGAVLSVILGTLLHFTYEWFGSNGLVGTFAAANESTWEHLKLLFWPVFLYGAVQFAVFGWKTPGFLYAKAMGLLAGLASIIVLFYTYSGVLGTNVLAVDILTFVLGVAVSFAVSYYLIRRQANLEIIYLLAGCTVLALLLLAFLCFTWFPPHIGLFQDPISGGYGFINR